MTLHEMPANCVVSGKPLNRAQVPLRSTDPGSQPVGAMTDDAGAFAFYDVDDGACPAASLASRARAFAGRIS